MGNELPIFDAAGLGGRVTVFAGGNSAEREISLQSGRAVFDALVASSISTDFIDIADSFVPQLIEDKPSFAFIAVHGRGGEDGTLQATLETLGIPYSGSPMLGSALAMDKVRSKCVWSAMGVPTAEFRQLDLSAGPVEPSELENIFNSLGGRVFVKPANEGSSFGMGYAESEVALIEAIEKAERYDQSILVERYIDGPEYTVPILEGFDLPAIGIETERDFYDFNAKYIDDNTRFLLPSGLAKSEEKELATLARKAFDALGCCGWGRVDIMRDKHSGQFLVLEVNTIPGLTDHSLVPKSAASIGLSFKDLVASIVNVALIRRYENANS